ncbi:MAG: response regulator transcription factor [Phycisphaerales bacterium]
MSSRPVILIVEDDAPIRRGMVDALSYAGFRTVEAADGRAGVEQARDGAIDLVLLDVLMPVMNGFDALRSIRAARPELPIILVTARGGESDRVRGLQDGADDYVVKPFSPRELIARVEAVLRRSPGRSSGPRALRIGPVAINLQRAEVQAPGADAASLTEREVSILRLLASCPDRPVSRDELLRYAWGLEPRGLETRTVDMAIRRLREKLGPDAEASIILTVRSKGYMLGGEVEVETA